MSLFPRTFKQELSPLFRMMDDYASLSRNLDNNFPALGQLRTFQPKFDVSEAKDGYTLHGELPGIERKDIKIEWMDGNTLTISGRTEHRSETGPQTHYEHPTVEDEGGVGSGTAKPHSKELSKSGSTQEVAKSSDAPKYWVSERSVGEFHRSFNFPARVDQDNVKASMKNGILEIVVPKSAKPAVKRIEIQASE